jgi:hypothetical protein
MGSIDIRVRDPSTPNSNRTSRGKSALANDRDDAKLSNILLTQMTLGNGRRVLHP